MMPATQPASSGGASRSRRWPLGDQDLVDGCSPSSRDLVPGHYLGVITLADTLDQGAPLS